MLNLLFQIDLVQVQVERLGPRAVKKLYHLPDVYWQMHENSATINIAGR
jgi:hypothetical protein